MGVGLGRPGLGSGSAAIRVDATSFCLTAGDAMKVGRHDAASSATPRPIRDGDVGLTRSDSGFRA